jgi:predicted metalloendopeptidase
MTGTIECMQKPTFDTSLRPQDDFFGYVNNVWLKENPIPASESRWGTFDVLRDASWKAVHEIIEEILAKDDSGLSPGQRTLRHFFESVLTFNDHSEKHIATLQEELQRITDSTTPSQLAHTLGRLHRIGLSPLFTEYVELDDKDSNMQVLRLHQSGLSLPNRDYYLEDSERMQDIRDAYRAHLDTMRSLLPELLDEASQTVFDTETALATVSWTDVELRDVQKNYTKMTLAQLKQRYSSFDWDAYFAGLGWQQPNNHIVVDQPTFFDAALRLFSERDTAEIQSYLSWHLVNGFSSWIDTTISKAVFDFYGRRLGGMKEQKPLWKRAVLLSDALVIGEALGKEYAARHFPDSSKTAVEAIVEEIRAAYHARIDRLTWMQEKTKQRAHTKLDNIKVFVGYPTKWKDISSLSFVPDNAIANIINARELNADIELVKIGTPPPDEEWYMNAHTVNAYNHPNRLEIVFPAAILQPPFYNPEASIGANLGGIGAVVGHEFTHSFDDQGAEFDEAGNTHQWISDTELTEFKRLAAIIVKQADAFETVPGVFLQGELILGEAIADIGGLELAAEALKRTAKKEEQENLFKDLFVTFASCECGSTTNERAVELAKTDPHPPSIFRVNNVVNHVDDFYDLYKVSDKDKLFLAPDSRAQIW